MIILKQREYGLIGKWALRRSNKLMNRVNEINSSIAKYEDIPKTKEERQVTSRLFKYAKKNWHEEVSCWRGYVYETRNNFSRRVRCL